MKLLVKRLWFPHNVDETVTALFRIPQMREKFDEGYKYDGEMRPRGMKICPRYWPAKGILEKLHEIDKGVYLVLTALELKGDYGGIYGRGENRRAIVSSHGYTNGLGGFYTDDVGFNATAFGEIGHALGLEHHEFDSKNPCEMSHNQFPHADWTSLDKVCFCDECYRKIK